MTSPEVVVIGTIEDHDGCRLQVGRDYSLVTIGPYRFTTEQFGGLLALAGRALAAAASGSGSECQAVVYDITPGDNLYVLTEALGEFASRLRGRFTTDPEGARSLNRLAEVADRMREQAEAAAAGKG